MIPLDNFYLAPDGQWYLSFEHYQVKKINDLAASIDQLDAIGSGETARRAKLWSEYTRLHDELIADGRFVFDDVTGMWAVEVGDWDGGDLPRSNGVPASPYTWGEWLDEKQGQDKQVHTCTQFVNVGFQFDKWVCKECGKDKE